jgi:hypothetical protein
MKKSVGHDGFVLSFAPENWSASRKFSQFPHTPLKTNKYFNRSLKATNDHLEKFKVLADIANDLYQGFDIDKQELAENGYSPAKHSKRYAAIIECCINELYASLDGIRDVTYYIYSKMQGVQRKSTSKLFTKAKKKEYDDSFPKEISELLLTAHDDWFLKLRKYRTEFTHGTLGTCSKDADTNKISYMHVDLGENNRPLVIDDFVTYINSVYANILELQSSFFNYLYSTLELEDSTAICGFYQGRVYTRLLSPEQQLTFQSGICKSVKYELTCPLSKECQAYNRAVTKT